MLPPVSLEAKRGGGGLLEFLFGKLVKATKGYKGRAQSYLIPCHHPPLPQCYRSVDVCPCPPEPQSCSPPPHSTNTHPPTQPPPTPNPSTSLPRSLIQCAECQRLPLPTFSPRLAAVIDGNGLRQINPFLVKIAPNNPSHPPACTLLTSTSGSGGGGVASGSVRSFLILHLYHSIWLSFHTTVPPYPVLRQRRPSSHSNKAISLPYLQLPFRPHNGWVMTALSGGGCGSWAILSSNGSSYCHSLYTCRNS
ncbi:putative RING finger protein 207 like [Dissostichus eleginoides]|uniref:RING finger protein 207 like n=1 Tax=Dissostichus eleginoides TaxID=100907 RepID=A0AAD9C0B8_DISEL|nr:putative RING finger protein 207 like [Dissostichus eleginoides]